jgi:hypothetical protein
VRCKAVTQQACIAISMRCKCLLIWRLEEFLCCCAALPITATAEADATVSAVVKLLQDYGQQFIRTSLLEDVASGIAHSLCATQVIS